MNSKNRHPRENDNAGGYYGAPNSYGYYGSSGGAYEGGESQQKGLKDYLLILREQVWYLVFVFSIIFIGSILYLIKATPVYEGKAMVQILRDDTTVLGVRSLDSSEIRGTDDLNTQIKILESIALVDEVYKRLQRDNLLESFLKPYNEGKGLTTDGVKKILLKNRTVSPQRLSMMVYLSYYHPNRELAARVANFYAEEYIHYNMKLNVDSSMKAIMELRERVSQQQKLVESTETKMANYRENHGSVSLEASSDIDHQELVELNKIVTDARKDFDIAQSRKLLLDQYIAGKKTIADLSFVNQIPQVAEIVKNLTSKKVEMSALTKKYGKLHPKMLEAEKTIEQLDTELSYALVSAKNEIYSNYEHSKEFLDQSQNRLTKKESVIIQLSKIQVEYNTLLRDMEVNEGLYRSMVLRLNTEMAQVDLKKANARIIDYAVPGLKPAKPKVFFILGLGVIGGLIGGVCLVYLVAFLDDRIKTAFDVESVVGLPLLGVIPRLMVLDTQEKAKCITSGRDKMVIEAFRAVDSLLRFSESSRNAKVITVSSTLPSEGKSFFTTNMGLTYAANNEKVLVIDTDLRMPSIANSLGLKNDNGVLQYCESNAKLEDVVQHSIHANFDVLTSGGRASNPTQVFIGDRFKELIKEARSKYDRIFIDSPPMGVVSDVMNILPETDGLIFVVKFNTVKRRVAKAYLTRILEAGVPIFGAVINQISFNSINYYYSNYHDGSYSDYYIKQDDDASGNSANEQKVSKFVRKLIKPKKTSSLAQV